MDTTIAAAIGKANRYRDPMVFDWIKAARMIRESGYKDAFAGLCEDWEYTGGPIFLDGKPVPREKKSTFLSSTWANPEIRIDGEVDDCFKMKEDLVNEGLMWNEDTFWPEEALKELNDGREG